VLHDLCEKRLASVHALPPVIQTGEHRKYEEHPESSTPSKIMKLGKTQFFGYIFLREFKSWTHQNRRKPASILALRAMGSKLTGH